MSWDKLKEMNQIFKVSSVIPLRYFYIYIYLDYFNFNINFLGKRTNLHWNPIIITTNNNNNNNNDKGLILRFSVKLDCGICFGIELY